MIVASRGGGFRLGNRLELFLHLGAFSHRTGIPVAVPSFSPFAKDFLGTREDGLCRFPRNRTPKWLPRLLIRSLAWLPARFPWVAPAIGGVCVDCPNETEFDLSSPAFEQLARRKRFVFLRSGWQYRDWSALPGFLPVATKFFYPAPSVEQTARTAVARARADADLLVGVHIRRTDFQTHLDGKFFFSPTFYAERMREVASSSPNRRAAFLICSDEPRSPQEFPGLKVSLSNLAATGDLAALSFCDCIMGPAISSFSAWAALIGHKPFLGLHPHSHGVSLTNFGPSPLLQRSPLI